MKILLIIDHFGPGGAQRQMVELACGLKRRGHDVQMFIYYPDQRFFRARIDEHNIHVHEHPKRGRLSPGLVFALRRVMREGRFDVAVSYLKSTNIYAQVARLLGGRVPLVVSERTSRHDDSSAVAALGRRVLHGSCAQVVANSATHAQWLKTKWWLRNKVRCIYNGVNVEDFASKPRVPQSARDVHLLGIGRIGPEKNVLNFVRGLGLFHERHGYVPQVSWAGARDERAAGQRYCAQIDAALADMPAVAERWHWLGVQSDIPALLAAHHAVVLPSFYEGLPNVVCEALAAGRPVLISDVCDHPLLTGDQERGVLFDPHRPQDIARALEELVKMDATGWEAMSRNARKFAQEHLTVTRMVDAYEQLFAQLTGVPLLGRQSSGEVH